MVARLCRYIYNAVILCASMDHLLMTLILCAFAFQSWNVSRPTEHTAYELVLATNRLDIASVSHRCSSKLRLLGQKVKSVNAASTAVGRKEWPPTSSRNIGGARSLRFHEETAEEIVQTPAAPSSRWIFEGMLAPDGSISSNKLMMEEGSGFAYYDPVHTRGRRPERNWNRNRTAGTQQRDSRTNVFVKSYPPCAEGLRDLIPCLNATAGGHLYRRCPNVNRGLGSCLIPAPAFYARQFKWPASKNQVRGLNIPNVPLLQQHRAAWKRPESSGKIIYVGDGDPRFPNGINEYVRDLAKKLQGIKFGTDIRLVLDIDCGSGSVAAALETQGVLALSIAGESSANNGVQLVVERGYPALVQSPGTVRLPYPSQAFDLIHCAACAVEWEEKGGLKLLEVDRILRAGGFFVWMDPSEGGDDWNGMEKLTKNMCWRIVARWGGKFALWQKPTNQTCYSTHTLSTPPMCNASVSADTSWNVQMQSCLVGFPKTGGAITYPWPIRLQLPPQRLQQAPAAGIEAAKSEAYTADLNYWAYILAFYVVDFGPVRAHEIHNVLDMNAGYGGFAAAISMKIPSLQWWVLNVVPVDQPGRLAVIFDRGLLGVYHDWCESLDVYPRTFDMVHSSGLFSSTLRCDMMDIVQEMDRLLRPGGFAIIRDQEDVLLQVQIVARAMHWKATVVDTESGPKGKDKVLNCQKTFWQPRTGENDKG